MRSALILFVIVVCCVVSINVTNLQGFNPFSKSDWGDVGDVIKGGFENLGDKVSEAFKKGIKFLDKTFHSAKDLVSEAFTKVKECVAVVGLGTEWASKRAAYETAKAALESANKLNALDPRLVSLDVAEATTKATIDLLQKSLDAAQSSAQALSKALQGLSVATGKGINIRSMSFEAYMSKLLDSAKGPRVSIDVVIFGQNVKKEVELDLSRPKSAAQALLKEILKEVREFKNLIVSVID
jgi:hypothetical protein